MSEYSRSMPERSASEISNWGLQSPRRKLLRTLLYCSLGVTICVMAYSALRIRHDRATMKEAQDRLVALRGLVQPTGRHLSNEFIDQDGGLLADPPSDPRKLLDPETLVVAHYAGDADDVAPVDWDGFHTHLSQATGKKVVGQEYTNSAQEVEAVKDGKIHLVALHAADTPYLVNNAGFVPVAVLGTPSGAHGNHLTVAVGANSLLKTLADIRGHKLTCTRPDSITGYRAAIVTLAEKTAMRPDVDYNIHFSHGQTRSIRGLVEGEYEVAALSNDKLQTMLKHGELKSSEFRIIYESQVIPRLTIGHVYNLQPELAAKLISASTSFENGGAAADDTTAERLRFVTVDYKKEFEFVRTMDDNFDPRIGKGHGNKSTP